MRPASLVLLIIGVGLRLGTALVASFKIPCRVEAPTITVSIGKQIIRIDRNVWGQPLRAANMSDVHLDADQRPVGWTIEDGPYPNGVRQGMWKHITKKPGGPPVESDIWFLDGCEVSVAEWEQRQ